MTKASPQFGPSGLTRRQFSSVTLALTGCLAMPSIARAAKARVVVIGGGAGGSTAAKYIARDSGGAIDVTLIEASKRYYSCFFSNLYLGGIRSYESIGHGYRNLAVDHSINVIHEWASGVDRSKRLVRLSSGATIGYDRLVLSPGIDIKYDSVPGYSIGAQSEIPHAWKSGTQIRLLKARVLAMRKGGTFIMVPPPNPYRCPPGPYERISMIAHLFTQHNPTAKIIILDPKYKFSKQGLFSEGWDTYYPGMIEWIDPDIHGGITRVNVDTMEFVTGFDTFKADAANIIPAQKAGAIAFASGVTDGDWCPINPSTMGSLADENIYVLGDASVASAMPKSAFSANAQAKVAANSIRGALTDSRIFPARYANTCWSSIAPDVAVKVGATYTGGKNKIEPVDTFISKTEESDDLRRRTYEESVSWYSSITKDMFGSG